MKNIFIVTSLLFCTNITLATPAPYYQSAKEISAILESHDVAYKIGFGSEISSIVRNTNGYTLVAGNCTLNVEVTYASPPKHGFTGPAQIELRIGEAVCLAGDEPKD